MRKKIGFIMISLMMVCMLGGCSAVDALGKIVGLLQSSQSSTGQNSTGQVYTEYEYASEEIPSEVAYDLTYSDEFTNALERVPMSEEQSEEPETSEEQNTEEAKETVPSIQTINGERTITLHELTVDVPDSWDIDYSVSTGDTLVFSQSNLSMMLGNYIAVSYDTQPYMSSPIAGMQSIEYAQMFMEMSMGTGSVVNDFKRIEDSAFDELCYYDVTDPDGIRSEIYMGMKNGYLYRLFWNCNYGESIENEDALQKMIDSAVFIDGTVA